jgi:hypothetical protein
MSSTSTQNLLHLVSKSIDVLGEEETVNVLRKATASAGKNDHIDFVVEMVCQKLNFKPEQLIDRTRNTKRLLAINFICYYCYLIGNISYKDLGVRIKRSRPLVYSYIKNMEEKRGNKSEAYYQEHFKEFDTQIKKYQKNKKATQPQKK